MSEQKSSPMIDISDNPNMWNRFFMAHSLFIIGSRDLDGNYNMAPKHMAMPLGFGPYFGFMATPRKTTYRNIQREKVFTVSCPNPDQLVLSSISASSREEDQTKPVIDHLPTTEAQKVDGKFLKDSYLQLECKLTDTLGKFGEWELIAGEIVAAHVHRDALRTGEIVANDNRIINEAPLLVYLHPDRFSIIDDSNLFPLPKNFKR